MATSVSYAARETSSTAAANELVLGGGLAPATTITFHSDNPDTPADENGDLILETNAGGPDPDTWIEYNGQIFTFTFTVVGSFTVGDTKIPPELWGKQVAKIVLSDGTILFFILDGTGTIALLDLLPNGRTSLTNITTTPPPTAICFCAGTEILTPAGPRKVESLRAGDTVLNDRGEARQLVWAGLSRFGAGDMLASPNLWPIRIPKDAIGPGLPMADLHVSPQHRIVLEGTEVEFMLGDRRVLAAAKHLVGSLAETVKPEAEVDYYHLLLEDHEILVANGLPCESFQPARRTIDVMSEESRVHLVEVLKALGEERMLSRKDALPGLDRSEATVLAHLIARRTKAPAMPLANPEPSVVSV